MLIDLHTHTTPESEDSYLTPDELIVNAKQANLDAICLTEHDRFWDDGDIAELCKRHNFLIFPGVEITTEEAHLLVFGLKKYIFGMHRASFVRRLVDEAGGVIIVAHPYRRHYLIDEGPEGERYYPALTRACESPLFELADAIEVLNGRGSENENAFSRQISERLNIPGIAASDAHAVKDIGRCATLFERRVTNLHELITELKEGRFRATSLDKT
ncbi:MAG: PHP domain-containing protein [Dehalococcoidia bacterium]